MSDSRRLSGLKVMVIDDSNTIRRSAEIFLKQAGCENRIMEYRYGEHNKPYLCDGALFFNLSHSGERVMAAVSEYETGCDIEQIKEADEAVARRFYQKHEYEHLLSVPEEERNELFFRYWVLKESYMKAKGQGIYLGPDTFGFRFGLEFPLVLHFNSVIA